MRKISYAFIFSLIIITFLSGCGTTVSHETTFEDVTIEDIVSKDIVSEDAVSDVKDNQVSSENELPAYIGKMELKYANEFDVDLYENGYATIHVADGNSYVLVPEGGMDITLDDENASFIHMPIDSIYLAATSAMDLFHELDSLSVISGCSTKGEDFSDSDVRNAIESDEIVYVGKYSAPDYEKLIALSTSLAIESTMIYHSPKIKEEIESIGIPVFVERSSYESSPLGRLEWIKLYGLLLGKTEEAISIFDKQEENVIEIIDGLKESDYRPKVVFFYLSSNGYVNVRKPGDYVSKMIEIAGGEYAFESLKIEEENALSTVNISWEDFYYYGKDADILIYNGTIDGGIVSKEELLNQNSMFNDFKAVKNNRVYCCGGNMHQESSKTGDVISEMHDVIEENEREYKYIIKVD